MALNAQDLRTKTVDELNKLAIDLRKEAMNLRFSLAGGQLENTAQLRTLRRDLARVKTVAGQLTRGEVQKAPAATKTTKKAAPKKAEAKKAAPKKAPKTAEAKKTDKGEA
mgnify:CR=1 FL=1